MLFYPETFDLLSALPESIHPALLIRHSVRYPILTASETFTAGLTPEGVELARQFGVELGAHRRLGRVAASPVGRCVDTAIAIAAGAGWAHKVRIENRLSHPFMARVWDNLPLCHGQDPFPGELAVLLRYIIEKPKGAAGSLDLFVTHDTVVGAVTGYFFCEEYSSGNWPDFLEGILLWMDGEKICMAWRGQQRAITLDALPAGAAFQFPLDFNSKIGSVAGGS
jgi:hypothetical protein